MHVKKSRGILTTLAILAGMIFFSGKTLAQTTTQQPIPPDCVIFISNLTTARSLPGANGFDNRTTECSSWTLAYQSIGFSALTLTFQSSVGSLTPTSFTTYTGTVVTGSAAPTSTTGSQSTFSNGTVTTPWVRVTLSGLTGSGTVNGILYGYKTGSGGGGGGGGGGGSCPAAIPCVVVGPAADGAAVSGAPVRIGGKDLSGNTQDILTNTSGNLVPSNDTIAGADGVTNTPATPSTAAGAQVYNRVLPSLFNGSTNDRDFACTNQAAISFSAASGSLQIVGLTASQVIRVCHISMAADVPTNITLQYGTGSNCAGSTTTIGGPYQNVTSIALSPGPDAAIRGAASNAFCVNSSASVTMGGIVIYAKY